MVKVMGINRFVIRAMVMVMVTTGTVMVTVRLF